MVTACQQILQASLNGVTCSEEEEQERVKLFALDESEFANSQYIRAFEHVAVQSLRAPQDATRVAEQGLQAVHNLITFTRAGKTVPLDSAVSDCFDPERRFSTYEVKGKVDYEDPSKLIAGYARLVDDWASKGQAELSAVRAMKMVSNNPEWCDLHGRNFVVIGALDEMSPTIELLKRGATVLAIDEPSETAWDELKHLTSKSTCGTLVLPYLDSVVGTNIQETFPEVAEWIVERTKTSPATIFVNLGESKFRSTKTENDLVLLAASCDAILEHVCNAVPESIIAHFSVPTEVHCVSESTVKLSTEKLDGHALQKSISSATEGRVFKRTKFEQVVERQVGGGRVPLGNAIKSQSHLGRNDTNARSFYIVNQMFESAGFHLAKQIQKWRTVVARSIGTHRWLADKRKHRVSASVLPMVLTGELGSYPAALAMFKGREKLGIPIGEPETCRTLGMLLLIRDLRDPTSPSNPTLQIDNPLEVFRDAAIHGGVWTCPFTLFSSNTVVASSTLMYRIGIAVACIAFLILFI